jgi:hypothetical protein
MSFLDTVIGVATVLKNNNKRSSYSFSALAGVISHPSLGIYTFTGQGIGDINVIMAADHTVHETSVDGGIFVMQIPGDNGTMAISMQQTSSFHIWLLKWANHLIASSTDRAEWARATAILRNTETGESHIITGISPGKIPDKSYQAQGQRVTWVLMCANIENTTA